MLQLLKRKTEAPPSGPPQYRRPGSLAIIDLQIGLADEVIAKFMEASSGANGDSERRDLQTAIGRLQDERRQLEAEKASTVEASVPSWWAERHDADIADFERWTNMHLAGSRAAVDQFLDRHEPRQAVRYAEQLVGEPLRLWRQRHGDER